MSDASDTGSSLITIVLVVFVVLKLTEVIDWSWFWVLSPIWISTLIWLTTLSVVMLVEWWRGGEL